MEIVQATIEDLEGMSNLFNFMACLIRILFKGAKTYIKKRIEMKIR